MKLKDLTENVAPWVNQAAARKNRVSAIDAEIERIRQQIATLRNRMEQLKEEKNRLQNPSVY